MTDNEIIKALEYCRQQGITSECERCKIKSGCRATLIENAFDLINRQKAEVEQWKEEANKHQSLWASACTEAKSEAIREFAERLKAEIKSDLYGDDVIPRGTIDWLVKEMTGQ